MENPEQWSAVTFRKQYAEYCNLLGEAHVILHDI